MTLNRKCNSVVSIVILLSLFIFSGNLNSATLYKRYLVVKDAGQDILCEPYIVAPDDYVTKLFKQKGEISNDDYPEFIRIFQRINPEVKDVNSISPEQKILIPLKKINPNAFPNQNTGIIDIPFITISTIPDILNKYSDTHTVEKGDVISKLVAKNYGNFGSSSYEEGIEILKALNPNIKDLNKIYAGQKLKLPSFSLRNELFYSALFDSSGKLKKDGKIDLNEIPNPTPVSDAEYFVDEAPPIQQAVSALGIKIKDKGIFFLPQKNGKDLKIDLSKTPLLEKPNGQKILIVDKNFSEETIQSLQNYWQNIQTITITEKTTFQHIISTIAQNETQRSRKNKIAFMDNDVRVSITSQWIVNDNTSAPTPSKLCISTIENMDEKTPTMLCSYLKQKNIILKEVISSQNLDSNNRETSQSSYTGIETYIRSTPQKAFVNDLVIALDLYYAPDIKISFPYSGLHIQTFTNLISTGSGEELIIDFSNLYGDAFNAIKASGLNVISIKKNDNVETIIIKIIKGLKLPFQIDPVFLGAKRPAKYNTSVRIFGYLIRKTSGQQYLILSSKIDRNLMNFIMHLGVDIIIIE